MKLSRESILEVREDIGGLLEQHYEELTRHKDVTKLAVDWGAYEFMEATDRLRIYTARAGENNERLVGYAVFFLDHHPHYRHQVRAVNDVLFLERPYRRGTAGIRLIQFADQALQAAGVDRIFWHLKPSTHEDGDLRPIFRRLGYDLEEYIVGRAVRPGG